MKYSIDRLERIKAILHKRLEASSDHEMRIMKEMFSTGTSFSDHPDWDKTVNYSMRLNKALSKIDELFELEVDDFINEEIEIV